MTTLSRIARYALLLCAMCLTAGCGERPVAEGPNVFILLIDTLRPDHLGCYGYDRNTSPEIDRLAGEGVVFRNVYAPSSWTLPSTASMFTSLYPQEHGAIDTTTGMSSKVVTMAERLHGAGYATAGFSANYSFITAERGFARGFDHFELFVKEGSDVSVPELNRTIELLDMFRKVTAADADELNLAALDWLDDREDTSRPVFIYLHYMDPHSPYEPPPPYDTVLDPDYPGTVDGSIEMFKAVQRSELKLTDRDRQHIIALYDGEIAFADSQVGTFVDGLDERRLLEDALVIVTSDHGEELFDHGKTGHGPTLYEEVIRVPLIMWQKEFEQPGATVDPYASLVDLVPTVLDVCGIKNRGKMRGRPLLPLGEAVGLDTAWAEVDEDRLFYSHKRALVWNNWKMITSADSRELYDLYADPHETTDLAGTRKKLAESLSLKIDDLSKKLERRKAATIHIDERRRRELESLGYVSRARR